MIKIDFAPPQAQLKQFAFVAVLGLPLIALAVLKFWIGGWNWSHDAVLWSFGAGLLQLLLFLVGVRIVTRIVFVVLMVVFAPIGFVLSHVLMAFVFYFVMLPIGLVFKLIGRDAMGRKLDPKAASYWHRREVQRAPASYFKLY